MKKFFIEIQNNKEIFFNNDYLIKKLYDDIINFDHKVNYKFNESTFIDGQNMDYYFKLIDDMYKFHKSFDNKIIITI